VTIHPKLGFCASIAHLHPVPCGSFIIPTMPLSRNSSTQVSQGPVAQLLIYTEEILELESQLRLARILRRLLRLSTFGAFIGFFAIYIF
jgi:hypothetical protein